jgi:hypothetical protein
MDQVFADNVPERLIGLIDVIRTINVVLIRDMVPVM